MHDRRAVGLRFVGPMLEKQTMKSDRGDRHPLESLSWNSAEKSELAFGKLSQKVEKESVLPTVHIPRSLAQIRSRVFSR